MIHRASRFAFCPRDGTALVPTRIDGRDRPTCPVCGFADFMHVQIGSNAIGSFHACLDDPVDRRVFSDDTHYDWVPTEAGKALEAKHGPLAWLHPRSEAWPPGLDQV